MYKHRHWGNQQTQVPMVKMIKACSHNPNNLVNYFFSSSSITADKKQSGEMTQKTDDRFGNVFNGIGCFEGTFSLQLKPNSKPY